MDDKYIHLKWIASIIATTQEDASWVMGLSTKFTITSLCFDTKEWRTLVPHGLTLTMVVNILSRNRANFVAGIIESQRLT